MPVSFEHGKKKGQVLFTKAVTKIPNNDPLLKLNIGETAVFRTGYPASVLAALGKSIHAKRLKTRDRLGLIRDVFALAENGTQSAATALEFAAGYKKETEYVVWSEIVGGLGKLYSIFGKESYIAKFETHALTLLAEIGKKITWTSKPKDHSAALLKVLILEAQGKYGDKKTIGHARKLFAAVTEKKNAIPADLRGVVYNTVARNGSASDYAKLLKLYKAAALHEEKNRIGRALGMFKQKELLQKTLALAISNAVRKQDSTRMIAIVSINPHGRDIAWQFIKRNWKLLNERYAGSRDLAHLFEPFSVSTALSQAKEIQQFLKKNPAPGTERTEQQVLEHIYSNAAWLARERKTLGAYLRG